MDGLSVAASIAGLVSLADVVFRIGTKYYKEVKESRKDVIQLLDEVKELSLLLHKLSDRKRKVLGFCNRSNPHPEFEMAKKLRHPLTGLWLTEGADFTGLVHNTKLKRAIITECLHGVEGTTEAAVAYFYCTHRDAATHRSSSILSSLAAQLARQDKGAYKDLEDYYDQLHIDSHLPGEPEVGGLIDVIRKMLGLFLQVYVIVDGLDECGSEVDSTLYVATELDHRINSKKLRLRNLELKDEIMTRLVDGAKGMQVKLHQIKLERPEACQNRQILVFHERFRWVARQLDCICELLTDKARLKALQKLPPTLPASYERILMRAEAHSDSVRVLVQRRLTLIAAPRPLSLRELCEAVSIRYDSDILDEDEHEILQWCVAASSEDPTMTLVLNLLTSHLRYLALKNYERFPEPTEEEIVHIRKRRQSHSFYEYASMWWPKYVNNEACNNQEEFKEAVHELLDIGKTPNFCSSRIPRLSAQLLLEDTQIVFSSF
ncbi:hypothetical protein B0T10DRAFT_572550 [Thelonectria olida]|uniref:Nephrocystin 3-like N-terminal domain-containing protein n=1 Tax=Thelonectria olida TaxID=1576542 RepID=A0A9P8W3S2_9HYPO|nr:hypothetical protein B0T10DRAFT_572550 [Thelonectria olida]